VERCRPYLGTFVTIEAESDAAIEAGFAAIERIHGLMSAHEAGSELSRLNRSSAEDPVSLSPDTLAVLERAQHWHRASDGLFDPALAGRSARQRGALPLHPGQPEPEADFSALAFDGSNAWLIEPALIDLGGIAKGHAVDMAIAAMKQAGATSGMVNAGGDLAAFGEPRAIHVHHPLHDRPMVEILLQDRALATSAGHVSNGTLDFDHLPGRADQFISVTIEAQNAIDADALTKIGWGPHPALAQLLDDVGARGLAIMADGSVQDLAA